MPVPVSVTNPRGAGLLAANNNVLETQGPFAKFKNTVSTEVTAKPATLSAEAQPALAAVVEPRTTEAGAPAVETNNLSFCYPGLDGRPLAGVPPVVQDMNIKLAPGSRCLLIGPNGAGKTTLLKVLGGKHMVPKESVSVLGQPPFHATALTTSGGLSYVGGNWERDIAFAGYAVPLQGDFPASRMIDSIANIDPARKARLIKVLDINPDWRMHLVSDGQRRRVQICCGLLRPFSVLLLDEITVDLDVLGRTDLMNFLREECEQRGATVIYATHIFDGLESWPTHLLYVARGQVCQFQPASAFPELSQGRLMELVLGWLREEQAEKQRLLGAARFIPEQWSDEVDSSAMVQQAEWSNGWAPGRMTSTFKDSTNAVMRM